MIAAILVLTVLLAAANGANDVPKGVATLAGAGVTRYRTAIIWGTIATFIGSLASITLASRLTSLFTKGVVDLTPTKAFTVSVLVGVVSWVALATVLRLPVSTTHAIVGSLIGAGVVQQADAVEWGTVRTKVALPLLVSVIVAFAIATLINRVTRGAPECICVQPSPALGFLGTASVQVKVGTNASCKVHGEAANASGARANGLTGLHWLSSGGASFARGMNNTPKIVAIAALTLVPLGWSTTTLAIVVGTAMVAGSLIAGRRVAHTLAEDVVKMSHTEGLKSNLTLSFLVGFGANRGLPMSTTHVSTGAISGASGGRLGRLNLHTLRQFALAWLATPAFAAAVAALTLVVLR